MTLADLYAHSADGRVELYWRHVDSSAGNITASYRLDSDVASGSGWTTISSAISGTANAYSATFSNSTTPRWFKVEDSEGVVTFADAAYAHSGTFQDAEGWSIVPLGTGKKCIFVASAASTPAGSNSNDGLTPNAPVLTTAYAIGTVGMNAGDHVLLKRGATFTLTSAISGIPNGSSATAMSMLGAYGPVADEKPILDIETVGTGFMAVDIEHGGGSAVNHIALTSLHVHVGTRVDNDQTPFWVYSATTGDNVLLEDLSAAEQAGGITVQIHESSTGLYTNVAIRRCVFRNGHSVNPLATRDQAILVDRCDGLLMEDCILIDNGYAVTPGTLDQYSHNMYITEHGSDVTMRNVLSMGADNQTRPGGLYERIAVIQAPLGFTAGGLGWNGTTYFSQDATYRDCLIDGSRNRDVGLGWGFWTADGTNGLSGSTATITLKDTLINLASLDGGTTVGSQILPYLRQGVSAGSETQVMDGVVIPRASTASSDYGLVHLENSPGAFRMVRCVLDAANSRPVFSEASATHPTWQFGDNNYYTARTDQATYGGWFINQNGASGRTVAGWASYVGDPTSGTSASIKLGSPPTFTEERRTTDYIEHVMGVGQTLTDFKDRCQLQRRGNWSTAYTAEYLIDWIRQGYDMPALLTSSGGAPNLRLAFSGNQIMLDTLGRLLMVGI